MKLKCDDCNITVIRKTVRPIVLCIDCASKRRREREIKARADKYGIQL